MLGSVKGIIPVTTTIWFAVVTKVFFSLPNFLVPIFPSHYNLIDGAQGFLSWPFCAQCVRAIVLLEN